MQNYKRYTWVGMILVMIATTLGACQKSQEAYLELSDKKDGASVYVVKSNPINLTIFPFSDEARTVNFAASFGAVGLPKSDIPVEFTFDQKAFDSLNVIRAATGLPLYQKFPENSFVLSGLPAIIPSGKVSSNLVTMTYYSKKFNPDISYMMPLTITSAAGYATGASKTVYFASPKVEEVRANTEGWIATASSEQLSGENTGLASALTDGNLNTIWHARYSGGAAGTYPYLIQFDMVTPIYVTKVSIAPRQNNGNGPTLFRLEGSLDGTTWSTLLDNQVFDPTKRDGTYQSYPLTNPTILRYIKVTLLQGKQTLSFLSEIAIYRY